MKTRFKQALGALCVLTVSLVLIGCGDTQTTTNGGSSSAPSTIKVNVGSSSKGAVSSVQLEIAQGLGYLKEEGIDANMIYFKSGTEAATALISGQVDFSVNAIEHAIKAREQNKNLKMIASFSMMPANTLVVSKSLRDSVKSVADLKGKKIGVTGVGSGTHVLAAYVLQKNGLSLSDVQIVPIGSASNFIAAFKNNAIDAAMSFDPATTQMISMDYGFALLDMSDEAGTKQVFGDGGYQFTGLLASEDSIKNKKDAAQRLVNAIVKTNKYIASHSAEDVVAKLADDVVGKDKDLYLKSFAHTKPTLSPDGVVTKQAVLNNVESIKAYDPKNATAQSLDPTSLFDMEFVEKTK